MGTGSYLALLAILASPFGAPPHAPPSTAPNPPAVATTSPSPAALDLLGIYPDGVRRGDTAVLVGHFANTGLRVTLNDKPVKATFVSGTEIKMVVPPTAPEGYGIVSVSNVYGSTGPRQILVVTEHPKFRGVSPAATVPGGTFEVSGDNFLYRLTTVSIGGERTTSQVFDHAHLRVNVPRDLSAGSYPVTVTTPLGAGYGTYTIVSSIGKPPELSVVQAGYAYAQIKVQVTSSPTSVVEGFDYGPTTAYGHVVTVPATNEVQLGPLHPGLLVHMRPFIAASPPLPGGPPAPVVYGQDMTVKLLPPTPPAIQIGQLYIGQGTDRRFDVQFGVNGHQLDTTYWLTYGQTHAETSQSRVLSLPSDPQDLFTECELEADDLQPGTYYWRLHARNAAGETVTHENSLVIS